MAKPTEMTYLSQADLFVHSGLDTEPWRDNLLRGARNPKVNPGQAGWVDMSQGIELRDAPAGKVGRDQGDVHAYGNGHFTLNPKIAQRLTVTLVKAMVAVDPANAELYKSNAKTLVTDFAKVGKEIRETFAPVAGLKVVTFHKAWDYFADAIPFEVVGTIEPKPSITPSPAQVAGDHRVDAARGREGGDLRNLRRRQARQIHRRPGGGEDDRAPGSRPGYPGSG